MYTAYMCIHIIHMYICIYTYVHVHTCRGNRCMHIYATYVYMYIYVSLFYVKMLAIYEIFLLVAFVMAFSRYSTTRAYECTHAYIHTYMHTCMHAYIHARTHTYMHTYMYTYINTYTYTYMNHRWSVCYFLKN